MYTLAHTSAHDHTLCFGPTQGTHLPSGPEPTRHGAGSICRTQRSASAHRRHVSTSTRSAELPTYTQPSLCSPKTCVHPMTHQKHRTHNTQRTTSHAQTTNTMYFELYTPPHGGRLHTHTPQRTGPPHPRDMHTLHTTPDTKYTLKPLL